MVWIKRLAGLLALLISTAGGIACVAGVVATWAAQSRVSETVERAGNRVDGALERVEDGTRKTHERLQEVRDNLHDFDQHVQGRVAELKGVPLDEAADIDTMERQLYARFAQAKAWVGFLQAASDLVEQLLTMIDSTGAFLAEDSHSAKDYLHAAAGGHQEFNALSALFDEAERDLGRIRETNDVEAYAAGLHSVYSRIDGALEKVIGLGQNFESGVSGTRSDLVNLHDRIQRKLLIGAIVVTAVLICIFLAEFSLLIHGWKLLRARRQ